MGSQRTDPLTMLVGHDHQAVVPTVQAIDSLSVINGINAAQTATLRCIMFRAAGNLSRLFGIKAG